jgi:hypothetical protein
MGHPFLVSAMGTVRGLGIRFVDEGGRSGFGLGRLGLDADGDDEVVGRGGADVLEAVEDVGGGEDDVAGAGGLGDAVVEVLELTGADEEQLGVGVTVRGVRHLAGGEEGLVDLEELARGKGAGEDRAAGAAVGGVLDGERGVGEDDGLGELAVGAGGGGGLGGGLDLGGGLGGEAGRAEGGEGREGDTEIATVEIFHGRHGTHRGGRLSAGDAGAA